MSPVNASLESSVRYLSHELGRKGISMNAISAGAERGRRNKMNVDRTVFAFAGFLILVSLTLSLIVHPYWQALAAFVGLNMFQAAFTGFCPLAMILKRSGLKTGAAFQ